MNMTSQSSQTFDPQDALDLIQRGKSTPLYRISETKSVHSVRVGGKQCFVVYTKTYKKVDLLGHTYPFRVGEKVMFRWNGRRMFGEVVTIVPKGVSAHSVAATSGLRVDYGFLAKSTPRGQVSYLVVVRRQEDRLFWPKLSELRKVEN